MTGKAGDNLAAWLAKVMDDQEGPLLRYAGRILGDPERGRDVVQDTFMRLLESGRDLEGSHLVQWLFTVCRNRCLDVCRKERRMTLLTEHAERTTAGAEPGPEAVRQRGRAGLARDRLRCPPCRPTSGRCFGFDFRTVFHTSRSPT